MRVIGLTVRTGLAGLLGLLQPSPVGAMPVSVLVEAQALRPVTLVNIFGDDDREPVVNGSLDDRELTAVGLITQDGQPGATAFLLGRRDLIVTSAHAFYAHGDFQSGTYAFLPAGDARAMVPIAEQAIVALGTRNPQVDHARDWAVVRLPRPVSEGYRPLDIATSLSLSAGIPNVRLAAFHRDRIRRDTRAIRHISKSCAIAPKRRDDRFGAVEAIALHDCDFDIISSGGPLLVRQDGALKVVAINAGHFPAERQGRASGPTAFARYDGRTNPNYGVRMNGELGRALQRLLTEPTS